VVQPEISFKVKSKGQEVFGLSIEKSAFLSCHVKEGDAHSDRLRVKELSITNCKHDGCFISGAIIENSQIDNLTSSGRLGSWLRGCLFSSLIIKGRISGVEIRATPSENEHFNEKHKQESIIFYENVDLAIDISEASFGGFTIFEGIPFHLIKLNPESHFILKEDLASEVPTDISWLKLVKKSATLTPGGVVFSIQGNSDRQKLQFEQCLELKQKGLLA
jgi:hypothetical protein